MKLSTSLNNYQEYLNTETNYEQLFNDFLCSDMEKIMKNKPIIIIEIWDDNKRQRENMKWTRKNVIEYILSMGYSLQGSNGEDFLFHHLDDI
jgi:hypothetical protein